VTIRIAKNHFLMIDGVKMRPKKKCGAENRKTHRLLQTTVTSKKANERGIGASECDFGKMVPLMRQGRRSVVY
jgi:hypothetical protein